MKNYFKQLGSGLLFILFLSSCTDDFTELNTDPKNFTEAAVTQSEYPLFVVSALYTPNYSPFEGISDGRGSFQLGHSLFPDVYANYFVTTAPNFDSDQFILVGGWLNGAYGWFYNQSAPNIKIAEDTAEELGFAIENAMMKVWRVYSYQRITDLWGPIPYSNFGNLENEVAYDSQEDIYNDFFITLDEAVSVLKPNAGETSFLGESDVVYQGNVGAWLKFANSLRLRMALRIKYVDKAKSKLEAEKAVADGVMDSNGDNALISTNNNFRNHYTTITQWGEFRMSGDMESILKGYQDPRIASYFAPSATPDDSDDPDGIEFPYEGVQNGQTKAKKQGVPSLNDLASDMASPYTTANSPGPAISVMNASEVYFLRAEGALEGWAMGGTSESLYNQGIDASHTELGYDGNDLSGNDYISSLNLPEAINDSVPAVSRVPIAYNAAGTAEQQLEQIITQKWIALFPNSEEAYAERRRTGYPTLMNRVNTLNSKIPVNQIPRRMPYVASEYSTNEKAVMEAVNSLLGGPDDGTTKLWWDAKN